MTRLLLLLLLLAAVVTVPALAQTRPQKPTPCWTGLEIMQDYPEAANYLAIGSVWLRLGMTKEQVSRTLQSYEIIRKDDDWRVITAMEEPRRSVFLEFTNGRLSYAWHEWPIRTSDDIVPAIFGAVNSLGLGLPPAQSGGPRARPLGCSIWTDVVSTVEAAADRVWVQCGPKSVLIAKGRAGSGPVESVVYVYLGMPRQP